MTVGSSTVGISTTNCDRSKFWTGIQVEIFFKNKNNSDRNFPGRDFIPAKQNVSTPLFKYHLSYLGIVALGIHEGARPDTTSALVIWQRLQNPTTKISHVCPISSNSLNSHFERPPSWRWTLHSIRYHIPSSGWPSRISTKYLESSPFHHQTTSIASNHGLHHIHIILESSSWPGMSREFMKFNKCFRFCSNLTQQCVISFLRVHSSI